MMKKQLYMAALVVVSTAGLQAMDLQLCKKQKVDSQLEDSQKCQELVELNEAFKKQKISHRQELDLHQVNVCNPYAIGMMSKQEFRSVVAQSACKSLSVDAAEAIAERLLKDEVWKDYFKQAPLTHVYSVALKKLDQMSGIMRDALKSALYKNMHQDFSQGIEAYHIPLYAHDSTVPLKEMHMVLDTIKKEPIESIPLIARKNIKIGSCVLDEKTIKDVAFNSSRNLAVVIAHNQMAKEETVSLVIIDCIHDQILFSKRVSSSAHVNNLEPAWRVCWHNGLIFYQTENGSWRYLLSEKLFKTYFERTWDLQGLMVYMAYKNGFELDKQLRYVHLPLENEEAHKSYVKKSFNQLFSKAKEFAAQHPRRQVYLERKAFMVDLVNMLNDEKIRKQYDELTRK